VNGLVLSDERVTLAPPPAGFAALLRDWYADPIVTRYLSLRFPPSLQSMEEWIGKLVASSANVVWAILAEDRAIGIVLLKDISWRSRQGSLGIGIGDTSAWGKGYGTAATVLATRCGFEELGLEKVTATAFAENVGSRRMLEKAGYRQYGLARRDDYRLGRWHDNWLGEALRDEWLAEHGA
jgi:RimJ/RimL family protein N-acetyltransferase